MTRFFGSIIGLRPEYTDRYIALHANTFPGVLRRISRSNIRNYSIFLLDGVLFSHLEYVGTDHAADMAAIGTDETTRQWWSLTDPMQAPLAERREGEWWADLTVWRAWAAAAEPDAVPSARFAFACARPAALPDGSAAVPIAGVRTARIFAARDTMYAFIEGGPDFDAAAFTATFARVMGQPMPARLMREVFHTDGLDDVPQTRVFVSGCFDMPHSGHVAFLEEAATYGALTVGIGSDATIHALKGRHTVNSQDERKYMLDALRCVSRCVINGGSGVLDFEQELRDLRPDRFVVNHDGDTPAKRALCERLGIEYIVLSRVPAAGLPARSTTALREQCVIPFRIDLAGGWLDQPWVSEHHPGPVLTISIEPTYDFNARSGMASSTRRKAIDLWRTRIPHGDLERLARVLFSYENPPGTKEVAGSQDALGIVMPGLNRHHYTGSYWPSRIDSVLDEDTLAWIEQRLHLVTLGPRVSSFSVLDDTRVTPAGARALAEAADACWAAIAARDSGAFGRAIRASFDAQVAMFPLMVDDDIRGVIAQYRERALGWKLSGAGGGGYLILVSDTPVDGALQITIRRNAYDQ